VFPNALPARNNQSTESSSRYGGFENEEKIRKKGRTFAESQNLNTGGGFPVQLRHFLDAALSCCLLAVTI
jgi:hypothetical protein